MNNLATILGEIGRPTEALPLCERSLQGCEAKFGPNHELSVVAVTNMSQILQGRKYSRFRVLLQPIIVIVIAGKKLAI